MFQAYILHSPAFERYYTGSCEYIDLRLKQHNDGLVRSTKVYRPWVLVYSESFMSRSEARKRELQIKSYKGGEAFKKLIQG